MPQGILVGGGSLGDQASIRLDTREGNHIPNERGKDIGPERRDAYIQLWRDILPHAHLRSSVSIYNCMGLVFASRRTSIDIGYIKYILREDDYRELSGPDEATKGDLVIYHYRGDATHVGIILSIERLSSIDDWEIWVLSKWGQVGEYVHDYRDVPAQFGEVAEYWTDRPTD